MERSWYGPKVDEFRACCLHQPKRSYEADSPYRKLATRWVCRMLLSSRRLSATVRTQPENLERVSVALGIRGPMSRNALLAHVKKMLGANREKWLPVGSPLGLNVGLMAEFAGLEVVERDVLGFLVLMQNEPMLHELLQQADQCSNDEAFALLSAALGHDVGAVKRAFHSKSPLAHAELVTLDVEPMCFLNKFQFMEGLVEGLLGEHTDLDSLLKSFFTVAETTELIEDDFPHLEQELALVCRYLEHAVSSQQRGTNILFYGVPGSGKTEFARLVAKKLGVRAVQVSPGTRQTDAKFRIGFYMLCQKFLEKTDRGLIIFDEAEDVFPVSAWERANRDTSKARINELLETNRTPAIWISNDVSQVDEAYLRRFDYSVKFARLPEGARERMVYRFVGSNAGSESVVKLLSNHEGLTPSLIVRALKVADATQAATDSDRTPIVKRVLDQWFELIGQRKTRERLPRLFGSVPIENLVQSDCDVPRLIKRIAAVEGHLAILFYGPPGTGKTELARELAAAADRRLIERRPSDLLGSYVGQSERNVADAFAEATEQRAILFIDEADSILPERGRANHSWELSLVNEALMAMEEFQGVLICATNDHERLDLASLRRFALKVRFDYLVHEQRESLFRAVVTERGMAVGLSAALEALRRLPPLAVGDFAAVERRLRALDEKPDAIAYVRLLQDEVGLRHGGNKAAPGFVH